MKVNPEILNLLRRQVNHELANESFYLKAASSLLLRGYTGLGTMMKGQASGEHDHAMGFLGYIEDINQSVVEITYDDVKCPEGLMDMINAVMDREVLTEKMIWAINDKADYATQEFLLKYIKEQVEEINLVQSLIDRLKLAGEDKGAILLIDHEYIK